MRILSRFAVGVAFLVVGCATPTPSPAPTALPTAELPPQEMTGCRPGTISTVVIHEPGTVAATGGAIIVREIPELNAVVVCADPNIVASLDSDPNVVDAAPEQLVGLIEPVSSYVATEAILSPMTRPNAEVDLWGMNLVRAKEAHQVTRGEGQLIAIIDTGVDCAHPDLAQGAGCIDLADVVGGGSIHPHGTHVACTAAAASQGEGVYGTAPRALIGGVRVLDSNGCGTDAGVAEGMVAAVKAGAGVLNLSLGSPSPSTILAQAVVFATDRGVAVVAAAGNNSSSQPGFPASYPGVISVGAVNRARLPAPFSNFGDTVDLGAPGVDTLSCIPGGGLAYYSGTSMAAPHVAGVAALLRERGVSPAFILPALRTGQTGPRELGGVVLDAMRAIGADLSPGPTGTAGAGPAPTRNPYPGPSASPTKTAPAATRTATRPPSTATLGPLCVGEVYARDARGAGYRPGVLICPTPTRAR